MISERLLNGIAVPDEWGCLFVLDYLAEMWRFKSDVVIVRFDVHFHDSRSGAPSSTTIMLTIDCPMRSFVGEELTQLKRYKLDELQDIQVSLTCGALVITSMYDVVLTGLDMCARQEGYNVQYLNQHPKTHKFLMPGELALREGDKLGVFRSPAGHAVMLCTENDIYFSRCQECITVAKKWLPPIKMAELLDWHIPRRPFAGRPDVVKEDKESWEHWISAVLLTRGENEYLEEWFHGNFKAGIDYVYIYDNNDEKDRITLDKIPVEYRDSVTIIPFVADTQLQYEAYDHWLSNYAEETAWVTFIDTDEIFEGDLTQLVDAMNGNVTNAELIWTIHNANSLVEKPKGLQAEAFTNVIPYPYVPLGKMLLQTRYVDKMYVHEAVLHPLLMRWKPDRDQFEALPESERRAWVPDAPVKLHHYLTRSFEEWVEKIYRGSCDPAYCRRLLQFFEFNTDPEYKERCLAWAKEHNVPFDLQMKGIAEVK